MQAPERQLPPICPLIDVPSVIEGALVAWICARRGSDRKIEHKRCSKRYGFDFTNQGAYPHKPNPGRDRMASTLFRGKLRLIMETMLE